MAGAPLIASSRRRTAGNAGDRRSMAAVLIVTAISASVIAASARWGSDWPAQQFRAWVAATQGLSAWTSRWYGGQALWGYSLLYPAVAGVIGSPATGAGSVVAGTYFGSRLAPGGLSRARTVLFRTAVVLTLLESLLIGQVPFLLGAAFGAGAVWAVLSRHSGVWAAAAALLCALASPLAGVFLAVVAAAVAAARGWRRSLWLSPCLAGAAIAWFAGGASGPDPMSAWQLVQLLFLCLVLAVMSARAYRPVGWFAVAYALVAGAAFAVANPVGGNVMRLGLVVVLPLTVVLAPAARTLVAAILAAALSVGAVVWPALPATAAMSSGASDLSRLPGYYAGLLGFLKTQNPLAGRLEIPFTQGHWESLYVARAFPIARGWERQSDLLYNAVLYRPLTAASYRRWLDANAVSLVALPDVPLDRGGRAEGVLLRRGVPYLRRIWSGPHWTVWRVQGVHPLVSGAAGLVSLRASSLTLRFSHAGSALVRERFSRWWEVTSGRACTQRGSGTWLQVNASAPGTVSLQVRITPDLHGSDTLCGGS